jgi:hypothetical protein
MTIELNRTERGTATLLDCFSCGRPFTYRDPKADGTSGRFCSDPCREWFDAGNPPYAPIGRLYGLPIGTHGFVINCAACGGDFDSKGLRCCSPGSTATGRRTPKQCRRSEWSQPRSAGARSAAEICRAGGTAVRCRRRRGFVPRAVRRKTPGRGFLPQTLFRMPKQQKSPCFMRARSGPPREVRHDLELYARPSKLSSLQAAVSEARTRL